MRRATRETGTRLGPAATGTTGQHTVTSTEKGAGMPEWAIEIEGLTCGYGPAPVVRGAALAVPAGGFVGLIGPSGAGKTTLLRAMLGGVPNSSGRVVVGGRPVGWGRPPVEIGYVPQIETVDWTFPVTVADVVLMGRVRRMGKLPWPSRADRRVVAAALDRLGIGDLARRHIRDLSGGQQQRVFLARALVGEPSILLLDEPTASVDVRTREETLRLLADLNLAGTTVVMSTHELSAVAGHLPWVVCVNRGIVAQGPPERVFTPPILSRTFGAPMRVVRDPASGDWLIGDAFASGLAALRPARDSLATFPHPHITESAS